MRTFIELIAQWALKFYTSPKTVIPLQNRILATPLPTASRLWYWFACDVLLQCAGRCMKCKPDDVYECSTSLVLLVTAVSWSPFTSHHGRLTAVLPVPDSVQRVVERLDAYNSPLCNPTYYFLITIITRKSTQREHTSARPPSYISITWSFDSPYAFGTEPVSVITEFEIFASKYIWKTTLTFFRVTWCHQARDYLIPQVPFLYVLHCNRVRNSGRFQDDGPLSYPGHDFEFLGSRDVINHMTSRFAACHFCWNRASISDRLGWFIVSWLGCCAWLYSLVFVTCEVLL